MLKALAFFRRQSAALLQARAACVPCRVHCMCGRSRHRSVRACWAVVHARSIHPWNAARTAQAVDGAAAAVDAATAEEEEEGEEHPPEAPRPRGGSLERAAELERLAGEVQRLSGQATRLLQARTAVGRFAPGRAHRLAAVLGLRSSG